MIAKVDSTVSTNVSEQVGVDGYPTLKFIAYGQPIDYPGDRTFEAMQKWLEETMTSGIEQISDEKVKELIGSTDFLLIQGASNEQIKLLRFAQTDGGAKFYSIEGSEFKVVLHLKNSKILEYNEDLDLKALKNWVFLNTLSPVVALSSNDAVKFVFENKNSLPSFLLLKNKDWSDAVNDKLIDFCSNNKDKFLCAWAGEEHDIYQGISRFFKNDGNEQSEIAYFDYGIKNGWKVPNPTSLTGIFGFI